MSDAALPIAAPAAPMIYSPRPLPAHLGWVGRGVAFLVASSCLGVLLLAARLTPSPTGIGTHTHLGLDRCAFEARTGLPCPSCGMTTSFAWLAHGNVVASFYVQPMGFVLALATAATVSAGYYVAFAGRPAYRLLSYLPARYYVGPLLALGVAAWAWKIFIHLRGIDGWH
jgi:hypothetical protein